MVIWHCEFHNASLSIAVKTGQSYFSIGISGEITGTINPVLEHPLRKYF